MCADYNIGNRKNIMYVFNDSGFGGAGQSLLDTLAEIKDKVNPVVIIRDDVDVEGKFAELGVKTYRVDFSVDYVKTGSADAKKKAQNFKQSYEAAMRLLPIIKSEGIDLIHINSSSSYFAAIAALKAHIPYVWHIRELMQEHYNYEFLNEELRVSLYKKADKLIAISDYVKGEYYKKYGIETFRLYNGFNILRFKDNIASERYSKKNFIIAAMITPEKGQWDAIRATELLIGRGHDDIEVNIVGGCVSTYVWALNKYIQMKNMENNIHILPFQDDLSSLRRQAAYAITCSKCEALGRVTVESMLAENVVIGARSGGTAEIIGENEEMGFLYELGNIESLADAMERAMDLDAAGKNALLQKAQKYAEDTFNSAKYCAELLKIYDEAISGYEAQEYKEFLDKIEEDYDSMKAGADIYNAVKKRTNVPYRQTAFPMAVKWLEIRQKGHSLAEYFVENNIRSISIYGMGMLGCRLYDELEGSSVQVKYLSDRNPNGMDAVFKFVRTDMEKLDVDAVVVTVISVEQQLVDEIKGYGYDKVIGLSEILYSFDRL